MQEIVWEKTALGIELGSTRIKAVLTGEGHEVLASGAADWENRFEDGVWTYPLEEAWAGVRQALAALSDEVRRHYRQPLRRVGALGISAMMHGYLAFDAEGRQLAPFRTWRNTCTAQAAAELTQLFGFNIPQRWSIAHLVQAVQNGEEHTGRIAYLTTLAGYIHWRLTGEKVLGVGDASGMFPIDTAAGTWDAAMLEKCNALLHGHGIGYTVQSILPRVLYAGQPAGRLSAEGAALLDASGTLEAGIPLCPPEGDAGTGMAATNSVAVRTGNVSAGTSVFAMVVLEKPLSRLYPEIDLVTTPSGRPVAMVHCNTCTSDLDAWVRLLGEMAEAAGAPLTKTQLYELFYHKALEAEPDCGGLVNFNCYAGEPVIGLEGGCPLFVRRPDARLNLSNFARAQLYSAMATLRLGMELLAGHENVRIDRLLGHGGLFKTPVVGQRLLAGALGVPVSVMETAGEGGPWGMALLAAYLRDGAAVPLEEYLEKEVFAGAQVTTLHPDPQDAAGFAQFAENYRLALGAEKAAAAALL